VNGRTEHSREYWRSRWLSVSYEAYHVSLHGKRPTVLDGLTGRSAVLSFLGTGVALLYLDEQLRTLVMSNPHSPPKFRVNGPVRKHRRLYKAFDVKDGDQLYLPPEKQSTIWVRSGIRSMRTTGPDERARSNHSSYFKRRRVPAKAPWDAARAASSNFCDAGQTSPSCSSRAGWLPSGCEQDGANPRAECWFHVGYRCAWTRVSRATPRVEVVTEGVLTRMLQTDPSLDGVAGRFFDRSRPSRHT